MAFEIVVPRLGWSMEEGTFVGWLKKDGDQVRPGDAVFELESEKASQEIEAVDEGILRIPPGGPEPGAVLKVGAVIGYLVAAGEAVPAGDQAPARAAQPARPETALPPAAAPSVRRLARELDVDLAEVDGTGPGGRILADDVQRASAQGRQQAPVAVAGKHSQPPAARTAFASPRAKRVAAEVGIDWRRLSGTGAGGRIRERDVRAAATQGDAAAARGGPGSRIPLSKRRRVIAQRMAASRQQTADVTLTTKADATNLVNLREQYKAMGESATVPSYQDIITKLVAEVLKRHPVLAGRWDEDAIAVPGEDALHVGIAVDTAEGLLVPVLRNVGTTPLTQLAQQSRSLIERARGGTLAAADLQGAVFTITNLGAYGIDAFTPIINTPETAILGLGAIRREAVVTDDGQIAARQQLTLSLSFDHRVVDGAPAAQFLQDVVKAIANPSAWLLG